MRTTNDCYVHHTGLYKRIGCVTNEEPTVSDLTDGEEKWRIVNKPKRYGTVFTFVLLFFRDLKYGQLPYRTLYTFCRNGRAKKNINQRTNGPVNAHLIYCPSKAQNIQNLENIW